MDERGVASLIEYTLFRNFMILLIALFLLFLQKRDPIEAGRAL